MWSWLSFLRLPLAYIQNKGDFFMLWCPGSNNEQTLHSETVLWEKHGVWPLCYSEEWWWWYPHNIAFSIDEFGTHFLTYNFTEFFCFFFFFFFPVKKPGNHTVSFSFTSRSKMRMGDSGSFRISYIYIFICIPVVKITWHANYYFILFLLNKGIYRLLRQCRITFDNDLPVGIQVHSFSRVFQLTFR